ncbi:Asp-tRNA(Asn)/Glu-tRNA(Gln) amidotransferase subunit GatB [Patescibacteria group bacterium]|nr:Asp-tRNA(Asn)/Glu-tRNA(Gln) amidotransferase subunit GatB [Patescibacteria group bacterium]
MPDQKYEAVIGLEVHVQLATKSKMFCRCDNQSEDATPNQNTCPVCLGMPGTLPVPNQTAIEWAIKAAMALGCTIPGESKFDRKQYFYPDLPKGYQISQYDQPLGGPGTFEFDLITKDGKVEPKKVGITRLHLEEDAGKLTHPDGADYSLVDLNRAGTPLAEIVTEPDFRSPAEAKAFMQELRLLMRTIGVSDADMEKGHLRADANISIRKVGDKKLGTKTELKNLNSFKFVEKGLAAEYKRQIEVMEKGEKIDQETRGFDEAKGKTVSQRGKEEAHDYRYFPEPDIPPLAPKELGVNAKGLPELPVAQKRSWRKAGVHSEVITLVGQDPVEVKAFATALEGTTDASAAGRFWLLGRNNKALAKDEFKSLMRFTIEASQDTTELSGPQAKQLLAKFIESGKCVKELLADPAFQPMDNADLGSTVDQAIKDNPQPVADFQSGNENADQVIVGAVMKATKGSADPGTVSKLVREKLAKR